MEKYGRTGQATDDNVIRSVHFACCIPKATNTYSEQVILIAFSTASMVTRKHLSVTFVHTLLFLFKPSSMDCNTALVEIQTIMIFVFRYHHRLA